MDLGQGLMYVATIIFAIILQISSKKTNVNTDNQRRTLNSTDDRENRETRENRALFLMYDLDNDGLLSPLEMTLVLQRVDHGPEIDEFVNRIRKFYGKFEKNGDGQLDQTEFVRAFRSSTPPTHVRPAEKYIFEAFNMFDNDSDGLLTFDEVSRKLQQLTSEVAVNELNKAITGADRNSNGIIDYAEFARALRKHSFDLPSIDG